MDASMGSSVARNGVRCRGPALAMVIVLFGQSCSSVTAQQCANTPEWPIDAKGHVTVPNGVTSIGANAFFMCTQLVSIDIPTSVTSIGHSAFLQCTSLAGVNIPHNVTSIGDSAFDGCTSLAAVSIPTSVASIGEYAFYGCTSLTTVVIPTSATSIGEYAFLECPCSQGLYVPGAQLLNCYNAGTGNYSCISPDGCTPAERGTNGSTSFAECLDEFTSGQGSCVQHYVCDKGVDSYPVCTETNTTGLGVPLAECQDSCLSPNKKYLCTAGGVCEVSLSGKGDTKEKCMSSCGKRTPVPG